MLSSRGNNGLTASLNLLTLDFPNKKVQIVETAYNFQYWPSSGVNYDTQDTWACTIAGQHQFVKDLVAELDKHPNVNGDGVVDIADINRIINIILGL